MSKLRINAEGRIKLFFSLSLFVYSIYISVTTEHHLIFLPMLASTFGDTSIMASRGCLGPAYHDKDLFKLGIVSFALAHILYMLDMPTKADTVIQLITIILIFIVAGTSRLNKTIPSAFYALVLILAFINAILFNWLTAVGYALFIISDGILAIFEEKNPKWQIPIWVFYVSAQICILSSFLLV